MNSYRRSNSLAFSSSIGPSTDCCPEGRFTWSMAGCQQQWLLTKIYIDNIMLLLFLCRIHPGNIDIIENLGIDAWKCFAKKILFLRFSDNFLLSWYHWSDKANQKFKDNAFVNFVSFGVCYVIEQVRLKYGTDWYWFLHCTKL